MVDRWEAAVEAQIRSAQQRGEFDNLPGAGKPIPGRGLPYDESWWIMSFLEREALPTDLLLPTPLQLRRKVEQIPGAHRARWTPTQPVVVLAPAVRSAHRRRHPRGSMQASRMILRRVERVA
ncbi:DUF1992 domain-containing protein [Micromonospora halophytica]|nr:DUF1992 domain-containing protein [Micromonospora halophytica]